MVYILENNYLRVSVESLGAELLSITGKKEKTEFLWDGSKPEFWGGRAPVLFPVVGRLKNGVFSYNGEQYRMPIHGFAKNLEFELVSQDTQQITFATSDTDETRVAYPFAFCLKIRYSLLDTQLKTEYIVENKGSERMYFTIGGHPGFRCPLEEGLTFDEYQIAFDQKESVDILDVTEDGLIARTKRTFLRDENTVPLSYSLFVPDALIFDSLRSTTVSLSSPKSTKSIVFDFSGFPYLGIWTVKDAPYICLEPWMGLPDYCDFQGGIEEKTGIVSLESGNHSSCHYSYSVSFYE